MPDKDILTIESVSMRDPQGSLVILDQTLLPGTTRFIELKTRHEVWDAIYLLQVRGAPAIGVAAAFGLYRIIRDCKSETSADFIKEVISVKTFLASARPTAVNLTWALDRMTARARAECSRPIEEIKAALYTEAVAINDENTAICRAIGEFGQAFIEDGMGVLTHCNAGFLATVRYGTALAPIYLAHERGCRLRVFADETRPLLQGARLTTYELQAAGIDTTLICDNMASMVMKNGWIQAVFVGCDRVAANGDTANKIGTSGVAILARYYGVPFYVCAPTSTIDMACPSGGAIKIEERGAEEVTEMWYSKRMAPADTKVYNPAFDITDAANITAIITEYGVARPPFSASLQKIFEQKTAF